MLPKISAAAYAAAMREKTFPTADPHAVVEQLRERRVALTGERDNATVARDTLWAEIAPEIARGQDAPREWDAVSKRAEVLDLQLNALELELADAEARALADEVRRQAEARKERQRALDD